LSKLVLLAAVICSTLIMGLLQKLSEFAKNVAVQHWCEV
jgi:hypothetical protein